MNQSAPTDQQNDGAERAAFGKRLREAREAHGLSREAVADKLKLDVDKIKDLEADDISRITSPVFFAGYLRSYARLVELPADELVADFQAVVNVAPAPANPTPNAAVDNLGEVPDELPAHMSMSRRSWKGLLVIGLTVLLIALIVSVMWFTRQGSDSKVELLEQRPLEPSLTDDAGAPVPRETLTETLSSADVETDTPIVATEEPEPSQASQVADENVVAAEPLNQGAQINEESTGSAVGEVAPAIAPPATQMVAEQNDSAPTTTEAIEQAPQDQNQATPDQISFVFTEDSWVEVTDAVGRRLMYRLGKAGEVSTVIGMAPFNVHLGFVNGVEMSVNGQIYDLSRFANRRTARFEVRVPAPQAQ